MATKPDTKIPFLVGMLFCGFGVGIGDYRGIALSIWGASLIIDSAVVE